MIKRPLIREADSRLSAVGCRASRQAGQHKPVRPRREREREREREKEREREGKRERERGKERERARTPSGAVEQRDNWAAHAHLGQHTADSRPGPVRVLRMPFMQALYAGHVQDLGPA